MKAENEILAETAFNIFNALSPLQEKRFLAMIGVSKMPKKTKVKSKISEAEIEEQIRHKYKKLRK